MIIIPDSSHQHQPGPEQMLLLHSDHLNCCLLLSNFLIAYTIITCKVIWSKKFDISFTINYGKASIQLIFPSLCEKHTMFMDRAQKSLINMGSFW